MDNGQDWLNMRLEGAECEPGRQAWALFRCGGEGGPQLPVLWVWTPTSRTPSGLRMTFQDWVAAESLPSAVRWVVKLGEGGGVVAESSIRLWGWRIFGRRGPVSWVGHRQMFQWLGVSGEGRWNLYQELGAFRHENVIRDLNPGGPWDTLWRRSEFIL